MLSVSAWRTPTATIRGTSQLLAVNAVRGHPVTNRKLCSQLYIHRHAPAKLFSRRFCYSAAWRENITVHVPQMAESIREGTMATISKKKGDRVENDEEIATIETDKIDVSVNAPKAGTFIDIFVAEGDTVTVGQAIASIQTDSSVDVKSEQEVKVQPEAPNRAHDEEHEKKPPNQPQATYASSQQPGLSKQQDSSPDSSSKIEATAKLISTSTTSSRPLRKEREVGADPLC